MDDLFAEFEDSEQFLDSGNDPDGGTESRPIGQGACQDYRAPQIHAGYPRDAYQHRDQNDVQGRLHEWPGDEERTREVERGHEGPCRKAENDTQGQDQSISRKAKIEKVCWKNASNGADRTEVIDRGQRIDKVTDVVHGWYPQKLYA
jgi:hypothetical protein